MRWTTALAALAVIPSLSFGALADTGDGALDVVLQKLKAGNISGALTDLDKSATLTAAQTIRARYYRAFAYKQLGKADMALAEITAILPPEGDSIKRKAFAELGGVYSEKAWSLLGAIYNTAGQFGKLKPIYDTMMQDFPTNPEWEFLRADALFNTGRYLEAATAYGDCTTKHASYSRAKEAAFRKEESLRRAGKYQDAYNYLMLLPKPTPEVEIRAAVRRSELLTLYLRNDFVLSQSLCADLIEKYPKEPSIYLAKWWQAVSLLNYLPSDLRDPKRGVSMLQELVRDYPGENMVTEWKMQIGDYYYVQGDQPSAIGIFQDLLNSTPDNYPSETWHPYFRYRLGCCLHIAGREAEASTMWQSVVDRYPTNGWAEISATRLKGGIR
jgi:TolA-binding protein